MVGCFIEKKEEQDSGADVQKQVDEMMTGWMGSEKAPVQHVGYESKGNPVARNNRLKCPSDASRGYPGLDVLVLGDVNVIVKVNKIITNGATESQERGHD